MNRMLWGCALACLAALAVPAAAAPRPVAPVQAPAAKQRLIVLTDIEADADDTESLVRLLLYANEIDIEGLIATTSTHQRARVAPESIRRVITAYGQVRDNLERHEPGFPHARNLLARVSQGRAEYGMAAVGDGKDSAGSDLIVRTLREPDERPLWISVWGGANTLAQALYRIRHDDSADEAKRLIARLRVYAISDQDDSGIWIRTQFPDLFYIVSPGGYGTATWGGINQTVDGYDNTTIGNAWIARNIQQGHGPLGAVYPDVAYGMEGDTPSFLSLITNGLNDPEHPDWGGWGGRYELYIPDIADFDPKGFNGNVPIEAQPRPIWTNAGDSFRQWLPNDYGRGIRWGATFSGARATIYRWRDDVQNDFAARMAWTTEPYKAANHPPVAVLATPDHMTVTSGQTLMLSARGSSDPDGDSLSYLWFQYPEAGSYKQPIAILNADNLWEVRIKAPDVSKTETAQFILRVTDKGTPPLSRYRRVFLTIEPQR